MQYASAMNCGSLCATNKGKVQVNICVGVAAIRHMLFFAANVLVGNRNKKIAPLIPNLIHLGSWHGLQCETLAFCENMLFQIN